MKQYRNRLNRVNIEKYSGDKALVELENMRSSLADNVDSAYFFHEMARVSNRKNHPKRDSVYYFLSQAVTLDPWQTEYMYSLVDYMYDEFFGANEIRGWINRFLEWRKDDIESRELIYFSETLIWSYSSTKEYDKIVDIITNLKEQTNYDCERILKKIRK